ncbi:MAG: DEAD/DEAH box helicase [Bacteroidetes bacterium]|nr:DEAD/DEAH box helicase [Bacteroidota bacterium]
MDPKYAAWEALKLNKQLLEGVQNCGFREPTAIQLKCIPPILGGAHVIGIAQTGTGKTAAYLIPLLLKLRYRQGVNPRAVVLAPTKELVLQIAEHGKKLSEFTDLRIVALYGGIGPKAQIEELTQGVDLIIATPGRLMEIYRKEGLVTKSIQTMVIDEADRMMDLNFMPQLRQLLEILPVKKQNLLFSATFPARVEKLSQEFLDFPVKIEVTPQATPAVSVKQGRYAVPNFRTKINLLTHLLKSPDLNRVMIFTRTKESADNICKYLDRSGLGPVRSIHSNKGQNSRINAIREFKSGEIRVLVSTDVSSRGIDVIKVSHVINFDVPVVYDDYVHRIGRTGRAFELGESLTFVTPADEYHIEKIEALIKTRINKLSLPSEVQVESTEFGESQDIAREIDRQIRRENPDYQGAFHDRKKK